jgi:ABC-2 type transport system permease protein
VRRVSTGMTWAAASIAVLSGCGSGGITAERVENAVMPTFVNLIHLQRSTLGLPPVEPSALRAFATCHRVGPGEAARGAGNWMCTIAWSYPGSRGPLRDAYELSVTMDGCYTDAFDGCVDTT